METPKLRAAEDPANKENSSNEPTTLASWLEAYLSVDGDSCEPTSYPLADVESDKLNTDTIENRVQQLTQDADVSNGFCCRCHHLFQHWPALDQNLDWDYAVGQTYSTEEIEASSRAGCKSCAFLWSRLAMDKQPLDIFRKVEARLAALKHPGRSSITIQNWGNPDDSQGVNSQLLWLNLPAKESTHCNAPGSQLVNFESHVLPIATKLRKEPEDPSELAKSWLIDCIASHENCRPLKKCSLPTRLVSIADNVVRLVETDSMDSTPQYATLSYCWGQAPFTSLRPDTLHTFLDEIHLQSLPRTFQDAIRLSRALGLSFIWIDALCIIQDEKDCNDWLKESGRMASIYGGSQVTLSVSSASDVSQGFFLEPTPKYSGGFISRVHTSETSRVQNFHSCSVHEESTIHTHLGGRAWAFQEKLLSPRTLHIGNQGIYWECRCSVKSQSLPGGFPGSLPLSRLVRAENREWDWREIVNTYSGASMTYESDKLPALSGIAAHQQELTCDQYLAGLWRKELMSMLSWYCLPPVTKRPAWRAPTWSWASLDRLCIITYTCVDDHEDLKPQARLLDAWTKPAGENVFGGVMDGEITLACASLVRANLYRTGLEKYHNDLAFAEELLNSKKRPHLTFSGLESAPLPVSLDCLDDEMQGKEEHVYLLPLYEGFSGSSRGTHADSDEEDDSLSGDETARSETEAGDEIQRALQNVNLEAQDEADSQPSDELWEREQLVTGIVLRPVPDVQGHYTRLGQFTFSNFPDRMVGYEMNDRNFYEETKGFMQGTGEETAKSASIRTISTGEHHAQRYVISIK